MYLSCFDPDAENVFFYPKKKTLEQISMRMHSLENILIILFSSDHLKVIFGSWFGQVVAREILVTAMITKKGLLNFGF